MSEFHLLYGLVYPVLFSSVTETTLRSSSQPTMITDSVSSDHSQYKGQCCCPEAPGQIPKEEWLAKKQEEARL